MVGNPSDWVYVNVTYGVTYKSVPFVTVTAPGDTSSATYQTMPMIDNITTTGFRFGWYAASGTFNARWQAIGEV